MLVLTASEAAEKQRSRPDGTASLTNYFGRMHGLDPGPQAFLADLRNASASIATHFHDVDQFQVFVRGDGTLGRSVLRPWSFHYADAFTTYGPIRSHDEGISFFTLRPAAALGHYAMPGSREHQRAPRGRNIVTGLELREPTSHPLATDLIPEHPDGLRALQLDLPAGSTSAPITSNGAGAYVIAAIGEITIGEGSLFEGSMIHLDEGDIVPQLTAGPNGATVLVLIFPKATERDGSDPAARGDLAACTYYDSSHVEG